jgi:phosphoglucosamine mutase
VALFGTDGIRARAGEGPLAPDQVNRLGIALGRLLRSQPGLFGNAGEARGAVLIGRDTRASGESIEAHLTGGIMQFGNEVWTAGILPTPGIAYLTKAWTCVLGIVVSASHNPAEDNGIKLLSPSGTKVPDEAELTVERLVADPNLRPPASPSTTIYRRVGNRSDEYIWFLRDQLGGSLAGMKIVVDCAHGATSAFAPALLQGLGATVIAVNASPDGRNINKNAGVLHPEPLAARVRQEGADLGAAYDGDGDRCILVDETGAVRDGDHILAAAAHGLAKGSVVVSTVMANYGLEVWLRERGIELRRTAVGDRYVADEMRRTGSPVGGEQSGHIIFADASPTGDGMLTTMRVLRMMRDRGRTLSQLCEGFRKTPQVLLNVPVRQKTPIETVAPLGAAIRAAERDLDGRVLVRYSGTEPLCRVMVEGTDEAKVRRVAESLADVVRQHLG